MFNAFGKEGWVDERLGQGAFKRLKEQAKGERLEGKLESHAVLTNNLPQLLLPNGKVYCQSHAIARWAARQNEGSSKCNLYPADDLEKCLLVDEVMALVDSTIALAPKDEDKELRLKNRKDYAAAATGPLHIALSVFERKIQRSEGGPFFLGSDLSLADLYLKKPLVDMILDKQFEGVEPAYLKQFPLLLEHTKAVEKHDLVKEYLKHYRN